MARTEITVQAIGRGASTAELINPTHDAAVGDGHWFNNQGRNNYIWVKNDSGAGITVTIQTNNNVDTDLETPDRTTPDIGTIGAGQEGIFGPYGGEYEQADPGATITNAVFVDLSATASVFIAVVKALPVNLA